jgi:hypothetical protein
MRGSLSFSLVFFFFVAVGCGGNVTSSNGGDASTDGATDSTADTPAGLCPTTPGAAGTPCPLVGLSCEYGDDPRTYCNSYEQCSASGWQGGGGACPPLPTGTCPPTLDDARTMSAPCAPNTMICTYGDRICVCSNCNGPCSTTSHFYCDTAPTDPRCPGARPLAGSPCSVEGASCTYGVCADSTVATRKCSGGIWIDQPSACPA